MSVKEELHDLVEALPEHEWHTARHFLRYLVQEAAAPVDPNGSWPDNADFFATASVEELAAQHGVSPITDGDELLGDFWPEEESADEFIAAVRQWRREDDGA